MTPPRLMTGRIINFNLHWPSAQRSMHNDLCKTSPCTTRMKKGTEQTYRKANGRSNGQTSMRKGRASRRNIGQTIEPTTLRTDSSTRGTQELLYRTTSLQPASAKLIRLNNDINGRKAILQREISGDFCPLRKCPHSSFLFTFLQFLPGT